MVKNIDWKNKPHMLRRDGENEDVELLEVFERREFRPDCAKTFREGVVREILCGDEASVSAL